MDFDARYAKLNDRQRQAVDTIDGPVMVVAGPGTGKTELLSMRAANILRKTDTLPENILCLTFTESGAAAMRKRLTEIIGPDAYKIAIHTFHSFGSEIISRNGEYFYHGAAFKPASELHSYELLRSIFDTLDFTNPLAGKMNGDYTHLYDVAGTISELKKSGLTNEELLKVLDQNDEVLDTIEPALADAFASRVSIKTAPQLAPIAQTLAEMDQPDMPLGISSLASVLALSLAHAVDSAIESDSSKPLTAWKNAHMEKNVHGALVCKARKRAEKLRAVSYIYYQYLVKMQESELYDFDDMVLRVVHAMEVFPDLTYNLQERYLYIMVDEFQDTNLAQARILYNLTSTSTGNEPNIMVVGDDDQAIYSFQGADVGNILNFRDRFETTAIITLKDNYRSAQPILHAARAVILQGENRLERYMSEIDKSLTPHHAPAAASTTLLSYERIEDERRGVAAAIRKQIDSGMAPGNIAVLARRHSELINLLPYLNEQDIAVNYERRDNVLESEIVAQVLLIARIVCYIADGELGHADALLPRLFAHEAWPVSRETIWKLSVHAYSHRGGWLEEMATDPELVPLIEWFQALANASLTQPAERLLDMITGYPDEDRDDGTFHSPLYPYFFHADTLRDAPDSYVTYLEALRTIRSQLRDYRPGEALELRDFVTFADLHMQLGQPITSVRVRAQTADDAVHLMTAHKSKGLEFTSVHVIGAIDSSWGEQVRSRSRLIGYPENLPLKPSGDSLDERLRLFFVAMTRAKSQLSISYSAAAENGKATMPASFLLNTGVEPTDVSSATDIATITHELRTEWYQPLITPRSLTMEAVLSPTLERYKLSVTHLTSFLDVTRGGPEQFLLNNLLHFPKVKHPSALYGTAIHDVLQRAHTHLRVTGNRKPIEDILQEFETSLEGYAMPALELQSYLQRGTAALNAFLAQHYETFTETQIVELGFKDQQSMIGDATLTGALDLVDIDETEKTIIVTDYKTGKPSSSWRGVTEPQKLKLHQYKQQLLFYKLLVEHSRDYHDYSVAEGKLQFVEPALNGSIMQLELSFDDDDVQRVSQLIEHVYRLITSLAIPNTDQYPKTLEGVRAFEDAILNGDY